MTVPRRQIVRPVYRCQLSLQAVSTSSSLELEIGAELGLIKPCWLWPSDAIWHPYQGGVGVLQLVGLVIDSGSSYPHIAEVEPMANAQDRLRDFNKPTKGE